jgi:hypothetical protein
MKTPPEVDRKTAAYRLFHWKYQVRIPRSLMESSEYINNVGYHVSGDARVDAMQSTSVLVMNQTAAGIAILHSQGAPVDDFLFLKKSDAADVYTDIQEHLQDWKRVTYQGIHPNDCPPIEDFRMFEAVAMALYRTAKFYEPDEASGNELRDRIMMLHRSRNPVGTDRYLRNKITDDKGQLRGYESIVDAIESQMLEG